MSKRRILVVDDEPDLTLLLRLNLERTGDYEVREENGGSLALPAAREFRPDVIVIDIMMPDMEGTDAAALIRDDPLVGDTPIIFLTAVVSREEAQQTMGAHRILAKPVLMEELLQVIEQEIARKG